MRLHKEALEEAKRSPCERRRYGVAIGSSEYPTSKIHTYHNARVCDSCNDGCIRTRLCLKSGEKTEVGAEIHAEQAFLINEGNYQTGDEIVLVGLEEAGELYDPKPCPTCAKMLWFAGYKYYSTLSYSWTKDVEGMDLKSFTKHSLYDLIKEYEAEVRVNATRNSTA